MRIATVTFHGPPYLSRGDEVAFFSWLEGIPGVTNVKGEHLDQLTAQSDDSKLTDEGLRELIAVHYRYGVQRRQ